MKGLIQSVENRKKINARRRRVAKFHSIKWNVVSLGIITISFGYIFAEAAMLWVK